MTIRLNSIGGLRVLSNVVLYSPYLKKETEIDKLVLSPWGLYCIEAKSFNTSIWGSINDDFWVGVTGRKSTKIYNPVMQNFEHIRCLKKRLKTITGNYINISNIVVVPDSCKISTDVRHMVMNVAELVDLLLSDSLKGDRLNFEQVASGLEKGGK